jgi:hypothetical protein
MKINIFIYTLKINRSINLKYNFPQDNLNLKGIINERYALYLKDLVEFSYSLIYVSNYEKMTGLLDNTFNKDYYEYSKIIYNSICPNKFTEKSIIFNKNIQLTSSFNRLLFVVHDKRALLKNMSDKGYIISQGPQA